MFELHTHSNNTLLPEGLNVSLLTNRHLATAPSMIHLMAPVSLSFLLTFKVQDFYFVSFTKYSKVQPGETLQINLLATDQVDNSREAVWSLEAPNQQAVCDNTLFILNIHSLTSSSFNRILMLSLPTMIATPIVYQLCSIFPATMIRLPA